MPSHRTHGAVGSAVGMGGSLTALVLASEGTIPQALFSGAQGGGDLAAFIALATFSGWLGGLLPDLLEPSDRNPRHRKFFHSVVVFVSLILLLVATLQGYILPGESRESFYLRTILFFSTLGYFSHLLLDWFTPRRLPWVR